MRSYGQFCSIARALDVVGDRWTLLIVRELLLGGPRRFTDLKNGLPGIATNLLTTRLKDLEAAGLVSHEHAPPPVATGLYDLTGDGRALESVLRALGLWGLRLMPGERPGEMLQASWLTYAPQWFCEDTDPTGPPAEIQLLASGEKAVIDLSDGQVRAHTGEASSPDLVIAGPACAVLGLVMRQIDLKRATELGLTLRGKRTLVHRLGMPGVSAPRA